MMKTDLLVTEQADNKAKVQTILNSTWGRKTRETHLNRRLERGRVKNLIAGSVPPIFPEGLEHGVSKLAVC
jgi:hypothetical protein